MQEFKGGKKQAQNSLEVLDTDHKLIESGLAESKVEISNPLACSSGERLTLGAANTQ